MRGSRLTGKAIGKTRKRLGPVRELWRARRDPFYRHECRQAAQWKAWIALLLTFAAAGLIYFCCIGWIALYALPGLLVAEGLLCEFGADTIEGLLLTPCSRGRILWCKFAARLRPMVWLAALLPVLGAVTGVTIATWEFGADSGDILSGLAYGLGIGLVAGGLWLGQCLTSGAFGIFAAVQARGRFATYLLTLLFVTVQVVVDLVLIFACTIVAGMTAALAAIPAAYGEPAVRMDLLVGGLAAGALLLAVRLILVSALLPHGLVWYAARHMDRTLLQDR